MPVRLQVRLGEISSVITFDYKINRPSWPTSPYKLSSFVPVRLGKINWDITLDYKKTVNWPP